MKQAAKMSLILFLLTVLLTACSGKQDLQDGYYTAQALEFSHGWHSIGCIHWDRCHWNEAWSAYKHYPSF